MKNIKKYINIGLTILLVLFFILSILDTNEGKKKTNFNQNNITTHVEKLTENGPRSIADKESNQKALDYIATSLDSWGFVNEDTTKKPAYLIQDFVAEDDRYQNWYLKNIIVHIPANGTNKTNEAIMFMGHTDSVPMGDGASDDGVAVAVMMEAINYYIDKINNGYTLNNDLVFCFVNGEEYGLYGSEAFMKEFDGFNNIVNRIKFGTNLESRGTSGTLIMFETAKNNYKTIKMFSSINKNIFTCSLATMIYDMMPNGTDFSNFKDAYQGLNFANISGGEDYHTQNDNTKNMSSSYISQQAQIVDSIIDKLANYELSNLYDADESALFFSYLNITTVVYNHTASIIFAILAIILLIANIILSITYRKENNIKKTLIAIGAVVTSLVATALVTYLFYFLFQLTATMFGTINIHMIGTITYSNIGIIIGIGIITLAISSFISYLAIKYGKIAKSDLIKAFAYTHALLGIVLSFVLADASYIFIFSAILLLINEVVITAVKKINLRDYNLDLIVTALYFPIITPILILATSALGLTMAYAYGLLFCLAIFNVGVHITSICEYLSIRKLISLFNKKEYKISKLEGSLHILALSAILFLIISAIHLNPSVNLQGKQNIGKLPYDDALVYIQSEDNTFEYRIYDLNAYNNVKEYAPKMKYNGEFYTCDAENKNIELKSKAVLNDNVLTITKNTIDSTIYLYITDSSNNATITISDGITSKEYKLDQNGTNLTIHSDCKVTVNGTASIEYTEVLRDYSSLIPSDYDKVEQLHFNLWLYSKYVIK